MRSYETRVRVLTASMVLALLCGCAGIGIVATSNPANKLDDAEVLFRQKNRPLPADKLIREAIEIYQQQDDPHGLGHAYRDYGDLLVSPAMAAQEELFRSGKIHFPDPSITFDNRPEKAREYWRKALEQYERAEARHTEAGEFDALTNAYFNSAWLRIQLGDRAAGCADFDRSLDAYRQNMRQNPNAHPAFPSRFASFPDATAAVKREAGCGSSAN